MPGAPGPGRRGPAAIWLQHRGRPRQEPLLHRGAQQRAGCLGEVRPRSHLPGSAENAGEWGARSSENSYRVPSTEQLEFVHRLFQKRHLWKLSTPHQVIVSEWRFSSACGRMAGAGRRDGLGRCTHPCAHYCGAAVFSVWGLTPSTPRPECVHGTGRDSRLGEVTGPWGPFPSLPLRPDPKGI